MNRRHPSTPWALTVGLTLALATSGCGGDHEADATGDPLDTVEAPDIGCSVRDTWPEACDAVAIPGLVVTVADGVGGAPVCDATVTVFEHGSTSDGRTLEVETFRDPCRYVDWFHGEGSWDITATTPTGATGRVTGVTVCLREGGCHLDTVDVTIVVE